MQIRAGYEISYDCPQPTPMIAMLSVHPSRIADLVTLDRMRLLRAPTGCAYCVRLLRAPTSCAYFVRLMALISR